MNLYFAGDAASECGTSYYSEYDPFDYLYNSGTQYSDPLYEAVNKIDRTPNSPANNEFYAKPSFNSFDLSGGFSTPTVPDWDARSDELPDFIMMPPTTAPPLPPRNLARQSSSADSSQLPLTRPPKAAVDRLKIATKLYENVTENRTYDAELLAFFNMVSVF